MPPTHRRRHHWMPDAACPKGERPPPEGRAGWLPSHGRSHAPPGKPGHGPGRRRSMARRGPPPVNGAMPRCPAAAPCRDQAHLRLTRRHPLEGRRREPNGGLRQRGGLVSGAIDHLERGRTSSSPRPSPTSSMLRPSSIVRWIRPANCVGPSRLFDLAAWTRRQSGGCCRPAPLPCEAPPHQPSGARQRTLGRRLSCSGRPLARPRGRP